MAFLGDDGFSIKIVPLSGFVIEVIDLTRTMGKIVYRLAISIGPTKEIGQSVSLQPQDCKSLMKHFPFPKWFVILGSEIAIVSAG